MALLAGVRHKLTQSTRTVVHHLKRHVGVGIICSVAYFDPYVYLLLQELR